MRLTLKLLILCLMASVLPTAAADSHGPKERVEETAEQLFSSLSTRASAATKDQARFESEVRTVLAEIVDFDAITLGVLGTYRDTLSTPQRKQFQHEFERSMIQLLTQALSELNDYDMKVEDARMSGDARAQVPVLVSTADGQKFEILFSLALADADWRVRNLIVNGVNLGLTYRNQFNEMMKTHKQQVESVIHAWSQTIVEAGKIE